MKGALVSTGAVLMVTPLHPVGHTTAIGGLGGITTMVGSDGVVLSRFLRPPTNRRDPFLPSELHGYPSNVLLPIFEIPPSDRSRDSTDVRRKQPQMKMMTSRQVSRHRRFLLFHRTISSIHRLLGLEEQWDKVSATHNPLPKLPGHYCCYYSSDFESFHLLLLCGHQQCR